MQEYSPRDPLAEFWRGEITIRKLRVMVEHLPPDSAHARAHHGNSWRDQEFMLAQIGDTLSVLTEITRVVNSENEQFRQPTPFKRPGDEKRAKKAAKQLERETRALRKTISQLLPEER